MQTLLAQTDGPQYGAFFSQMPLEIVTEIFCLLPSFINVFALAATCTRLRAIWATNVNTIYGKVVQRSIPCWRHARVFLADQGGPPLEVPLSISDIVRMVRNAHMVENAMHQFERPIVCRVQSAGISAQEFYGAGAHRHPPSLTPTERPRFIRSYYWLCGMMKMDASGWQPRLESMTLKQLYLLYEMTRLTQSIGREEVVTAPPFPDADPDSTVAINSSQSAQRRALGKEIWKHIERTYQRIHHREAEWPWIFAKHEGFLWFIVIWDHWQGSLKYIVCDRQPTIPSPRPSFEKQYLWDKSSDEES